MRISTRLRLAALFPVLVALLVGATLYLAQRRVDRANEQLHLASRVRIMGFEQILLLQDYLLNGSARAVSQFQSHQREKGSLIARLDSDQPEDQELIDPLRKGQEDLGSLFNLLSSGRLADKRPIAGALLVRAQEVRAAAERLENTQKERMSILQKRVGLLTVAAVIALAVATLTVLWAATRRLAQGVELLNDGMRRIAAGETDMPIALPSQDELGELASRFNDMRQSLREAEARVAERTLQLERRNWLYAGLNGLLERMRGNPSVQELADSVVSGLADYVGAPVGALFHAQNGVLHLVGRHAYRACAGVPESFALGEGLVGQAAASGQTMELAELPADYILVGSGLGQMPVRHVFALPLRFDDDVVGVVELGALAPLDAARLEFLDLAAGSIAIALCMAQARDAEKALLAKTQQQAEELQVQQEELTASNEELEEQTQRLQVSEERLRAQQEELQVSNEELEEKNDLLERQKREVEQGRRELATKADELALASKYKSEFLANMSHELRTPLNSLLLLALSLAENKEGNLTAEQIECARVIHSGGTDLLSLINEILDLSKIEAGRMELQLASVSIDELRESLHASFGHMARAKGLDFEVAVAADLPAEIITDRKRLEQILRNLLSNALKFTEHGGIKVSFGRIPTGIDLSGGDLTTDSALAFTVQDTGIGIAPDKHQMIFEAFQQADGTTTRRFGGTGLGLTISRELATLLGGEIQLQSAPGEGSTFTLYLPLASRASVKGDAKPASVAPPAERPTMAAPAAAEAAPAPVDDRTTIGSEDRAILIVEDDPNFAALLCNECRAKGFKCLAASTGGAGLELAGRYLPAAIILDLHLPGMDGWAVLSTLKDDMRTRHIPVHIVSGVEDSGNAIHRGAVGYAMKPLDREHLEEVFRKLAAAGTPGLRRVLVVEDEAGMRRNTIEILRSDDVSIDEAATGAEALAALRDRHYDCVVLDLRLPDMDGSALLDQLAAEGVALPPVVVHTGAELSADAEASLRAHADAIVIKDVRSPERLLDEVSLFLHRVVSQMPEKQQRIIHDLYDADVRLRGKKVLVVDDDMRTTFAVSKLLSDNGMQPLKAADGAKALKLLEDHPDTAIVLMDIMMPVMDGYEAMRHIRAQEQHRKLPIIALTAKAMPEDREKCLAAGASDYLPKPVDAARLVSMMRVWLYG